MFFLSPYSSYQATEGNYSVVTAVPNLFGTRDRFRGRQFFHRQGGRAGEDGSGGNASGGVPSLARRSPPAVRPGA